MPLELNLRERERGGEVAYPLHFCLWDYSRTIGGAHEARNAAYAAAIHNTSSKFARRWSNTLLYPLLHFPQEAIR